MSKIDSLEAEREAILSRMKSNRERYRRMLMDNSDSHMHGSYLHGDESASSNLHSSPSYASHYGQRSHSGHSFADYRDYTTPAVRFVKEHPLLCAAAVAAVVVIGPRRIGRAARSAVSSGSALTALTLRNQANVDLAGRLISQVVDYMQQRSRTRPPL
jgi:hypothetical protein